jgi:hypothetical protein
MVAVVATLYFQRFPDGCARLPFDGCLTVANRSFWLPSPIEMSAVFAVFRRTATMLFSLAF